MLNILEQLRTRLEHVAPARVGTAVVVLALAVLLWLRFVLPPPAPGRPLTPTLVLLLALAFRLVAGLLHGVGSTGAAGVLTLLAILCLVLGATGVAALLLFDVALRT